MNVALQAPADFVLRQQKLWDLCHSCRRLDDSVWTLGPTQFPWGCQDKPPTRQQVAALTFFHQHRRSFVLLRSR